jgi:hypothetical protein
MTRTCDQCGKHLITHRADARFCGKDCNNAWHNEQRRSGTATDKHLTPVSGGVGSRGGNVRSVDEARILQSESKERDRWRLVMEIQVHRTLLSTGYFHTDDLDALEVPPIASEVKGTLINAVRARGYMQSTGVLRKVAHAAANARKAWIYKITAKGRAELPGLVADLQKEIAGTSADTRGDGHGGSSERSTAEVSSFTSAPPVSAGSGEAGLTGPGSGAGEDRAPGFVDPSDTSTASPDKPLAGVDTVARASAAKEHAGGVHSGEEIPGGRGQAPMSMAEPVDATPGEPAPLSLLPEPDPESWAA